jgi:site-specific recombinase XerD
LTLSKAISEFIAETRLTKAPATAAAYESDLRRMAKHAKIDTVLHFTAELALAYLEWESSQGARMATLHRKQASLRAFARWGVRHRILAEDPTAALPLIRRQQTLPRPFSSAEITRLWALELGDPQERLLRAILFFTGMRVSAIAAIRLADITQEPPTIRTTGKGGRAQIVPMHARLAELVLAHVLERTDLKPQRLLLCHADGRPWRRKYIEGVTHRWGREAHVPDCTPHRFRHSLATALLDVTGNLRTVQEALGHADVKSTQIYTQVRAETVQQAIQRLPETWGD